MRLCRKLGRLLYQGAHGHVEGSHCSDFRIHHGIDGNRHTRHWENHQARPHANAGGARCTGSKTKTVFLLDAGKIKVHICLAGRIDQNLSQGVIEGEAAGSTAKVIQSADPIKTTTISCMDQYERCARKGQKLSKCHSKIVSLLWSFQASGLSLDPEVCTCSNLNTASDHALQLDLK